MLLKMIKGWNFAELFLRNLDENQSNLWILKDLKQWSSFLWKSLNKIRGLSQCFEVLSKEEYWFLAIQNSLLEIEIITGSNSRSENLVIFMGVEDFLLAK